MYISNALALTEDSSFSSSRLLTTITTWLVLCVLRRACREKASEPRLACSVAQSCPTLRPHGLQPARLLHPRDSPGKNTAAGCHFLLQGLFPTQGSNPCCLLCLLYWWADSRPLLIMWILFPEVSVFWIP